jgi:hypothetical protein
MFKEKIVERIGKKTNKDFFPWYQDKVLELASFFIKNTKEESIPVENDKFFEPYKLEVIAR